MSRIHKTAIVHKKVTIGKDVIIGPYCVLDSPDIILEDGVEIKSHVVIEGHVHIKKGTKIASYASIGVATTNLSFKGEVTFVVIGENCDIREYVSINSSCGEGTTVSIGNNCLLMPYSFVAHNCTVGDYVIMTNGATLAGRVKVGNYVILGGLCAIAQWLRIGDHVMVGGGAMVAQDIPPYTLCSGDRAEVSSLNIVGLKRRGFTPQLQRNLAKAFRLTYKSGLRWAEAKEQILETIPQSDQIDNWIEFCSTAKKGIAKYRKKSQGQGTEKSLLG
ncbi:MAG: Acyl-[acyl-carrier-protein]--UDP-N-acetylglucosamine O-acyltransferase [Chlamydiia bacterium]|nr:Acyl-[acyl-carrier-protein]--UDP-N-acetylglucosamine O-acyltransferase [Chlamydiia bacterium]